MRNFELLMENNMLFVICVYLLMILLVYGVVWELYLSKVVERLGENVGVLVENYTAEEIAVIVRKNLECPLVEEIGTDEHGMMFFRCGTERYYSEIGADRFYIVQKGRFGINKSRLSAKGRELQQCIADIFSDNPQKDRQKAEKKQRIVRRSIIASWAAKAGLFICFGYILFQMFGGMDLLKSNGVSLVKFSNYSSEYTINDALRASCEKWKWSSSKDGDTTYAYFTGTTYNGNELEMLFELNQDGECQIISTQLDGEDYTLFTGVLLEAIYSNLEIDFQ